MKAKDVFLPSVTRADIIVIDQETKENRYPLAYDENPALIENGLIPDDRNTGDILQFKEEFDIVRAHITDQSQASPYNTGIDFNNSIISIINPYGQVLEGYRQDTLDSEEDLWNGALIYQLDSTQILDYGEYKIEVVPYDNAGNSGRKLTYTFRYQTDEDTTEPDNKPPKQPEIKFLLPDEPKIIIKVKDASTEEQPSSGINYQETQDSIKVLLDGSTVAGNITYTSGKDVETGDVMCSFEFTITSPSSAGLVEGRYTVEVVSVDNNGLTYPEDGKPYTLFFLLDNTSPEVTPGYPKEGDIFQFFPELVYVKLKDDVSAIDQSNSAIKLLNPDNGEIPWITEFKLDEGEKEAELILKAPEGDNPEIQKLIIDGWYRLCVIAADVSGNRNAEEQHITFRFDPNATDVLMEPAADSRKNGDINEIRFTFSNRSVDFDLNAATVLIDLKGLDGISIIGPPASTINKSTAVFTPTVPLTIDGWYSITLTLKDDEENTIDFVKGFRYDNTPPEILGDVDINLDELYVSATVEDMGDASGIDANRTGVVLFGGTESAATERVPGYLDNSVTVTENINDGGKQVEIVRQLTSKWVYKQSLPSGGYTIRVTAVDEAGNAKSSDVTFNIDAQPPVLSNAEMTILESGEETTTQIDVNLAPEARPINYLVKEITTTLSDDQTGLNLKESSIQLWFSLTKASVREEIISSVQSKPPASLTVSPTVPLSLSGYYTLSITVADLSGNEANLEWQFLFDNIPPNIGAIKAVGGISDYEISENDIIFAQFSEIKVELDDEGTSMDTIDTSLLVRNNTTGNIVAGKLNNTETDSSWIASKTLESGTYILEITAVDEANNSTQKTINFSVDARNTPQLVKLVAGQSATESNVPYSGGIVSKMFHKLTATLEALEDTTLALAQSQITLIGPNGKVEGTQSLISESDKKGSIIFTLDNPPTIDGTSDGRYTIEIDAADDTKFLPRHFTVEFIYDTMSPVISRLILEGKEYQFADETVYANDVNSLTIVLSDSSGIDMEATNFVVKYPDSPDDITYKGSDLSVSPFIFSLPLENLSANGTYILEVLPVDVAGNRPSSPYQARFVFDTTAPQIASSTPVADTTATGVLSTITVTLTDGSGSGVAPELSSLMLTKNDVPIDGVLSYDVDTLTWEFLTPLSANTPSADGLYCITVSAEDRLGNQQTHSFNFNYAASSPLLISTTPEQNEWTKGPVTEIQAVFRTQTQGDIGVSNITLIRQPFDKDTAIVVVDSEDAAIEKLNANEYRLGYVLLGLLEDGYYQIKIDLSYDESAKANYESVFYYDASPPYINNLCLGRVYTVAQDKNTFPADGSATNTPLKEVSVTFADNVGVDAQKVNLSLIGPRGEIDASQVTEGQTPAPTRNTISLQFPILSANGSADGEYRLVVSSIADTLGNTAATPEEITFIYDTTPPSIVSLTPSPDISVTSPIDSVIVTLTDNLNPMGETVKGSGVDTTTSWVRLIGISGEPILASSNINQEADEYVLTLSFAALAGDGSADGTYAIEVYSQDRVGNTSQITKFNFNYTTEGPILASVNPPDKSGLNVPLNQVKVQFAPNKGRELDLDASHITINGPNGIVSGNTVRSEVSPEDTLLYIFDEPVGYDGQYTVDITAVDKEGAQAHYSTSFYCDTQPPQIARDAKGKLMIIPSPGSMVNGALTEIRAKLTDAGMGIDLNNSIIQLTGQAGSILAPDLSLGGELTNNGVDEVIFTLSNPLSPEKGTNGLYTVNVIPVDKLGNAAPTITQFTYDTIAPTLVSTSPEVGAVITEPIDSIEVVLTDSAGSGLNVANTQITVTIDGDTILDGKQIYDGNNTFLWYFNEALSVDQTDALSLTVTISTEDNLGNARIITCDFNYTTVAPVLLSVSPEENSKLNTPIKEIRAVLKDRSHTGIKFGGASYIMLSKTPFSGTEVLIAGTLDDNGNDTLIFTPDDNLSTDGQSDGMYNLIIVAADNAEHVALYKKSFFYDTQPPTAQVISPEVDVTSDSISRISARLTDEGVGIDLNSSEITLASPSGSITGQKVHDGVDTISLLFPQLPMDGTADGIYTITVIPVDLSSNSPAVPLRKSFTYDTTPPSIVSVKSGGQALHSLPEIQIMAPISSLSVTLEDVNGIALSSSSLSLRSPNGNIEGGESQKLEVSQQRATLQLNFETPLILQGMYLLTVDAYDKLYNFVKIEYELEYSINAPTLASMNPPHKSVTNTPISSITVLLDDKGGEGIDTSVSTISVLGPNAEGTQHIPAELPLTPGLLEWDFTFPLATDGTQDGKYTVSIVAVDKKTRGVLTLTDDNSRYFIYDTQPPEVLSIFGETVEIKGELRDGLVISDRLSYISAHLNEGDEFILSEGTSPLKTETTAGIDLMASDIKLTGPSGEITAQKSNDGKETLRLQFPALTDDGLYTVEVTPVDKVGNTTAYPTKVTYLLDTTPPQLVSTVPADGVIAPSGLTSVKALVSDEGSGVDGNNSSIKLFDANGELVEGETVLSGESELTYYVSSSPLSQGEHTIEVYVADKSKNLLNVPQANCSTYISKFSVSTQISQSVIVTPTDNAALREPIDEVTAVFADDDGTTVSIDVENSSINVVKVTGEQLPITLSGELTYDVKYNKLVFTFDRQFATDGSDDGYYEIFISVASTGFVLGDGIYPPKTGIKEIQYQPTSFRYDTTAPSINLVYPAEGSIVVSQIAQISALLEDVAIDLGNSSIKLKGPSGFVIGNQVDNGVDTLIYRLFSPLAINGSDDGTYTVQVEPKDLLGNGYPVPKEFNFLYDTQPPTLIKSEPAANTTVLVPLEKISLTFSDLTGVDATKSNISLTGPGGLVPGSLVPGDWSAISNHQYPITFVFSEPLDANSEEDDGDYTVNLQLIDKAGNKQETSFTFTYTTISPGITTLVPKANTYVNSLKDITVLLYDNSGTGIDVTRSTIGLEGPNGDVPGQLTTEGIDTLIFTPDNNTGLSLRDDGEYVITIVAYDNAHHSAHYQRIFYYDTQPPDVESLSPANGSALNSPFSVSATLSDNLSGVDITLSTIELKGPGGELIGEQTSDGKNTLVCSFAPFATDGSFVLSDGIHPLKTETDDGVYTISILPVDIAGNKPAEPISASFHYDTQPPEVSSTYPLADSTIREVISSVSVALTDDGSGLDLGNSTISLTGPNGAVLGELSDDGISKVFFNFETLRHDGSDDGEYKIGVVAVDKAGNSGSVVLRPDKETISFFYYSDAPELVSTTPKAGEGLQTPIYEVSATLKDVSGTGLDLSQTTLRLIGEDGIPVSGGQSDNAVPGQIQHTATVTFTLHHPFATDGSQDGEYVLHIDAKDKRGKQGNYKVHFFYDTMAPSVLSVFPEDNAIINSPFSVVEGKLTDEHAQVDLFSSTIRLIGPNGEVKGIGKNDGEDTIKLSFSLLLTDGSDDGEYTLSIMPVDLLGNTLATPLTYTFLYDTMPPVVVETIPAKDEIIAGSAVSGFNIRVTLDDGDGSGVDADWRDGEPLLRITDDEGREISGEQYFVSHDGIHPFETETTAVPHLKGTLMDLVLPLSDLSLPPSITSSRYYIHVVCADIAGNKGEEVRIPFSFDYQPPVLVKMTPEAGKMVNGIIDEINIEISDEGSGVNAENTLITVLSPDGNEIIGEYPNTPTPQNPITFSFRPTVPLSVNGWYTITIEAQDFANNKINITPSFFYDSIPPQIDEVVALPSSTLITEGGVIGGTINSITAGISDVGNAPLTGSSGIDVKNTKVVLREKLDEESIDEWNTVPGALNNSDTATIWNVSSTDGLTQSGLYKIEISVFDQAGNASNRTINFRYSDTPSQMPELVVLTPAHSARLNKPISVVTAQLKDNSGSGIDFSSSTIEVSGAGISQADTISNDQIDIVLWHFASPLATDGSDDGIYLVNINAVDNAGNSKVFPTIKFTYDTQAPQVQGMYTPKTADAEISGVGGIAKSISEVSAILADAGGTGIDVEKSNITLEDSDGKLIDGEHNNGVFVSHEGIHPLKTETVEEGSSTLLLQYRFSPLRADGTDDGIYTIKILSADVLGNTTALQYQFRYDTSAPTIKNATPKPAAIVVASIGSVRVELTDGVGVDVEESTITVTGPEGAEVVLGANKEFFSSPTQNGEDALIYVFAHPLKMDGSHDGIYTVSVYAVDLLGNFFRYNYDFTYTATAPALVSITPRDEEEINEPIDEIVAILNDRSGKGIDVNRTSLKLFSSVGEIEGVGGISPDGSSVFLRLDRSLATDGTDEGLYTIKLEAVDNSGASVTYISTFLYDTRPPEVISTVPDESSYLAKSPLPPFTKGGGISVVSARFRDDGVGINLRDSEINLVQAPTVLVGEKTDNGADRISFNFSPFATDGSDDGEYTIRIIPVDRLGNKPIVPIEKKFFYDTTPPNVVEVTPMGDSTLLSPISRVTVMLEDTAPDSSLGVGVDFTLSSLSLSGPNGKVNGTAGKDNENSLWLDFPPLKSDGSADGTYTLEVLPVDMLGNAPVKPMEYQFTYNTKAPMLLNISPANNALLNTPTSQISAVVGKGLDLNRCRISVEGEGVSPSDFYSTLGTDTLVYSFAERFATDGSDDGEYIVTIVAMGKPPVSATYTTRFTYDTQPPLVEVGSFSLSYLSDGATKTFPNEISVQLADAHAGVDFVLGDGIHPPKTEIVERSSLKLFGPTGEIAGRNTNNGVDTIKLDFSSDVLTNLNDGVYTIQVKPVDKLGNKTATPYSFRFRLDTTPPTVVGVCLERRYTPAQDRDSRVVSGGLVTGDQSPIVITSPFERIEVSLNDEGVGVDVESLKLRLLGPDGVMDGDVREVTPKDAEDVTLQWNLTTPLKGDGNDDGEYAIEVVAADALGNSVLTTIDIVYLTTVPELISVNGYVYQNTEKPLFATRIPLQNVTVMFKDRSGTGIDFDKSRLELQGPGVSESDRIDNNGTNELSWVFAHPLATDGSDDGLYILNVTVADKSPNSINYAPISFLCDTTAPTVEHWSIGALEQWSKELQRPDTFIIASPFDEIEVILADNGVGVDVENSTIKLVGPNGPVKGTMTNDGVDTLRLRFEQRKDNGSDDGEYVILVNPKDKLGNGATIALSETFLYDTQPPKLSDTHPVEGETITTPLKEISVVLIDNLSGVDVANTSISVTGPNGPVLGDISFFVLSEGIHPLKTETGEDGDREPPLQFIFKEELASDGTDDGTYTIIVVPVDNAGNVAEGMRGIEFTYTTTSPLLISTIPKANSNLNSALTYISATIKDQSGSGLDLDNSRILLSGQKGMVSGSSQNDGDNTLLFYLDAPLSNDGSDDGEYEMSILATDKTGANANFVRRFLYDTTAPEVKLLIPPDTSAFSTPISKISATLEDTGSGVDVANSTIGLKGPKGEIVGQKTNDGVSVISLEFGSGTDAMDDGIYQILILPVDNAGNSPPQKITSSFICDTRPPEVVKAHAGAGSIVISFPFSGEGTPSRSVEVAIDKIEVTLRDELSGVDVDNSTLSLIGPRGKVDGITKIKVESGNGKGGSTMMAPYFPLSTFTFVFAPLPLDGTANGEYRIEVTAVDMASNVLADSFVGSFIYQPTAPELLSTTPSDGSKLSMPINTISAVLIDRKGSAPTQSGISLQGTQMRVFSPGGDELSGKLTKETVDEGKAELTLHLEKLFATDGSEDGRYGIYITTVDNRGNSGEYSLQFTYDTTAPKVVGTVPADDAILNTPLSNVSASLSDAYAGIDLVASSISLYKGKLGQNPNEPASGPILSVDGIQKNDGDSMIKLDFPTLSTNGSDDGIYIIDIMPVDMLKNTLVSPERYTFIYDTTAPQLIKTEPASAVVVTGIRLFKVSASFHDDGGMDVTSSEIMLTGPNGNTITGEISTPPEVLANSATGDVTITFYFDTSLSVEGDDDGEYRINIKAVDMANNTKEYTSTFIYESGSIDAPKIEYISVQPLAFSPNADGIHDTTQISYQLDRASSVTAEILAPQSGTGDTREIVRLLANKQIQPPGRHTLTWNGVGSVAAQLRPATQSTPIFAPDGEYVVRIVATDMTSNKTQTRKTHVILDTQPPAVGVPTLSSNPITPNGDGLADTTTLSFSISNSNPTDGLKIDFYESDGVAKLPSSVVIPTFVGDGMYSVTWDGTDGISNVPLPDGEYRFVIKAFDEAGNSRTQSGVLLLDSSPPQINIFFSDIKVELRRELEEEFRSLSTTSTLKFTNSSPIAIAGTIADVSPIQKLEISIKKDGKPFASWSKIEIQEGQFDFRFSPPSDGRYDFSLRANDNLGYETLLNDVVSVIYDTTPPEHITTVISNSEEFPLAPSDIAAVSNGQRITVKSSWDATDYMVTVDMSSLDSEFLEEPIQITDKGDGEYTLEYQISPANRETDGEKHITIQAIDVAGNTTIEENIRVRLDNIAPNILSLETPQKIFKNGAKVTLNLKADSEGYQVFADFHPLDTEYADSLYSVEELGGGDYNIHYHISRNNKTTDGEISLPVFITDSANIAQQNITLTLDNNPPSILSLDVADNPDGVVGNGVKLTLLLLADAPGYKVNADFSEIDSGYKDGGEIVTDNQNGNYLISYKISDENTIADGKGLKIFVKVADSANNESSKYISVDLDNTPPEITSIKNADEDNIYRNGDTITITLTLKDESEYPNSGESVSQIYADFSAVDTAYSANKVHIAQPEALETSATKNTYTIQYTISQNNAKGKDGTLKNLPVVITVSDGMNETSDDTFTINLDNHPPALTVNSPAEGEVVFSPKVSVSGTVELDATLLINDEEIAYDGKIPSEVGVFAITLDVKQDINHIEIKAVDEAKNTTVIRRDVRYIPQATVEEGGKITLNGEVDDGMPDNDTHIKIPPKSLRKNTAIIIEHIPNFNGTSALHPLATYKFSLVEQNTTNNTAETYSGDSVRFLIPAEITLRYSDQNLETERNIKIFRWDGVRWREVGGRLDADKNTVTAKVDSLSIYAVFATYPELYGETENRFRIAQPLLTPNGDGVNERVDFPPNTTIIRIFDKRGKIIRKVNTNGETWSWRGKDESYVIVQPGLYIYQVEFVDGQIKTGTIVVAR